MIMGWDYSRFEGLVPPAKLMWLSRLLCNVFGHPQRSYYSYGLDFQNPEELCARCARPRIKT